MVHFPALVDRTQRRRSTPSPHSESKRLPRHSRVKPGGPPHQRRTTSTWGTRLSCPSVGLHAPVRGERLLPPSPARTHHRESRPTPRRESPCTQPSGQSGPLRGGRQPRRGVRRARDGRAANGCEDRRGAESGRRPSSRQPRASGRLTLRHARQPDARRGGPPPASHPWGGSAATPRGAQTRSAARRRKAASRGKDTGWAHRAQTIPRPPKMP